MVVWSTISVRGAETLCSKNFISSIMPNTHWYFYLQDCADHTLNWGAVGIRELTLDANELESKGVIFQKGLNYFWCPV